MAYSRLFSTLSFTVKNYFTLACKRNVFYRSGKIATPKQPIDILPKRFMFGIRRKVNPETLRESDKIPEGYQLIYRNTMENYLTISKLGTFFTAAITSVLLIFSDKTTALNIESYKNRQRKLASSEGELLFFTTAFILICVAVHALVIKVPVRIYKNPLEKNYRAVFHGAIPFSKRVVEFDKSSIRKLDGSAILPWKDSAYEIKPGVVAIIMEHYFKVPAEMNVMMGHQKESD